MSTKTPEKATKDKYIEAVGRRKSATARVRIFTADKRSVVVNDVDYAEYFKTPEQRRTIEEALETIESGDTFKVTAKVSGSGLRAQSEAVRHGLSRALVEHNETHRGVLKKAGFLKRDPRSKERKKPGLKKARKSAQWSKR